ncbi:winged helix-turn-helix transcriptional regulator [Streptomyces profundus]|uniref:winged helix-turn-helix transcriptional regulator n=1 Tax=Streptomyces profundus TaxID=2867410 RepID=UPI001D16D660|nr:helix-turn-helix domain-containing protein [Streptomyces sp. MA3_2.13]UED87048.1 helix-turn-helix transcriptional regulator [Streptomyces sp. MA3_2.13]
MDTGFDHEKHGCYDVFSRDCPPRAVLELIAGKWTMLALVALADGRAMRFNELRRRLDGVTQKMLTQTLRALEREGLLTRTVYPTVPPRVEYRLTALGGEIAKLVTRIAAWSTASIDEIRAARAAYDQRLHHTPRPLSA